MHWFFPDYTGMFAAAWVLQICWMREVLCVYPECASVAGGMVRKAVFESRLCHTWRWGGCWSKQLFFEGDGSPHARKKGSKPDSSARTCSSADIPCVCNAFSWECVQSCDDVWNGLAHPSPAMVLQVAGRFLQDRDGHGSGAWHIRLGNQDVEVNNFACWFLARSACLSDMWQGQGGLILLWLFGLCKHVQEVAQAVARGGGDTTDCREIS